MTLEIIKRPGKRPLAPRESTFTKVFWDNLATGEFKTTICQTCNRLMFPPRQHCSACWSKQMQWVTLSGKGKLYARTTVHAAADTFQPQVPFSVGIVDLQEGIRLIASILDEPDHINNDDDIDLVVLQYDDGALFAVRK